MPDFIKFELTDKKTGVKVNLGDLIPKNLPIRMLDIVNEEAYIGANDIRTEIIRSMQKTNRAPWYYWRGKKPNRKKHFPSDPGSAPAVDSGELISRILADNRIDEIEVGAEAGAYYAEWLELGTKDGKLKPRPFLMPAAEEEWPKAEKNIIKAIDNYLGSL